MPELLIGCGQDRQKKLGLKNKESWENLITLDSNPDHNPDILLDLESIVLPFENDFLDEIHAYDVLEHTGRQGDWRFFFNQWSEFWRVLKPGGIFAAVVPSITGQWAWGDPGHTRVISLGSLSFLSQPHYAEQVGKTPMSDYRHIYKADFDLVFDGNPNPEQFWFVLQAVKPSRIAK